MFSEFCSEGGGHGSTHAPNAGTGSGLLLQVSKLQEFADSGRYALFCWFDCTIQCLGVLLLF